MPAKCPNCGGETKLEAIRAAGGRCPHCKARIKVKFTGVPRQVKRAPGTVPARNLRNSLESIGPYEVITEISRGGMGIVYKARDTSLKKTVAIKVLIRGGNASEEERKRFRREAEAAAKLQHSNIVPIHSVGVCEGLHYFVMDFIEGEQLDALATRGSVSPRQALDYGEQLADALAYAHAAGVIHRDIKPANVIIDRYGRPQLMDFGLAKEMDAGDRTQLTQVGTTMGTPTYMPPEQAEGDLEGIDTQSDVYSLGALLYEMLTGRPPFEGPTTMAILMKVLEEEPRRPRRINPRIHPDIETICLKAMAKEKRERYKSAEALREDIRRFKAGEAISATQPGAGRMFRRWVRRHRELVATLLVAVLALGGWGGYRAWQDRQERLLTEALKRGHITDMLRDAAGCLADPSPGEDQLERAASSYRRVLDLDPGGAAEKDARHGLRRIEEIRRERRIRFFLDRGHKYIRGQNYEAAADMFTVVLREYDPQSREAEKGLRVARGTGTLRVSSDPPGAQVFLASGDAFPEPPRSSPPAKLGKLLEQTTPFKDPVDVPMGLHRVTLVMKGHGRQSLPVMVGRNRDVVLGKVKLIRADAVGGREAAANLVLVPGGKVVLEDGNEEVVKPFYMDRYEYPNLLGARPVCGKTRAEDKQDWSWRTAQALAQAAGKKLPTRAQWMLAAAGSEELRFPYGNDFNGERAAVNLTVKEGPLPAGSKPGDRSPFGIYDMSGNASEWVRIPGRDDRGHAGNDPDDDEDEDDDDDEPPPYYREEEIHDACGGNWTSRVPDQSSSRYVRLYTGADEAPMVGFRCTLEKGEKAVPGKPRALPEEPKIGAEVKEVWVTECPKDMVLIRPKPGTEAHKLVPYAFCIDRYEYPNEKGKPPKTDVSWDQASRLARARGKRLPTFKEWRVACGGPDLLAYPFGREHEPGKLCIDFKMADKDKPDPCGEDKWKGSRSPWGEAYDLSGNVWEWVGDWFNYNKGSGKRGITGGCWISEPYQAKSSYWEGLAPEKSNDATGFRCVVRLREKKAAEK